QGWQASWLLGAGRESSFVARPATARGGLSRGDGCSRAPGHSPASRGCGCGCSAGIVPRRRTAMGGSRSEADRGGTKTEVRCSVAGAAAQPTTDRKSTRLNSSHVAISYAVFCLKKKKKSTWLCEAM